LLSILVLTLVHPSLETELGLGVLVFVLLWNEGRRRRVVLRRVVVVRVTPRPSLPLRLSLVLHLVSELVLGTLVSSLSISTSAVVLLMVGHLVPHDV